MVHKDKSCVRNDNLQNFKEIIQWDNFQKAVWNDNLQRASKFSFYFGNYNSSAPLISVDNLFSETLKISNVKIQNFQFCFSIRALIIGSKGDKISKKSTDTDISESSPKSLESFVTPAADLIHNW